MEFRQCQTSSRWRCRPAEHSYESAEEFSTAPWVSLTCLRSVRVGVDAARFSIHQLVRVPVTVSPLLAEATGSEGDCRVSFPRSDGDKSQRKRKKGGHRFFWFSTSATSSSSSSSSCGPSRDPLSLPPHNETRSRSPHVTVRQTAGPNEFRPKFTSAKYCTL